jgi:hypothetical protein
MHEIAPFLVGLLIGIVGGVYGGYRYGSRLVSDASKIRTDVKTL